MRLNLKKMLLSALCFGVIGMHNCIAAAQGSALSLPYPSRPPGNARSTQATISVASLRVPLKARNHLERAAAASRTHRVMDCNRELAAALAIDPTYSEALQFRAARNLFNKDFLAARADAVAALNSDPAVSWAAIILASADNGLHQYADASLILKNLQGSAADSWQAQYELARSETGLGHPAAALEASRLLLTHAPAGFATIHLVRANALILNRHYSEALAQIDLYCAASPGESARPDLVETRRRLLASPLQGPLDTQIASASVMPR